MFQCPVCFPTISDAIHFAMFLPSIFWPKLPSAGPQACARSVSVPPLPPTAEPFFACAPPAQQGREPVPFEGICPCFKDNFKLCFSMFVKRVVVKLNVYKTVIVIDCSIFFSWISSISGPSKYTQTQKSRQSVLLLHNQGSPSRGISPKRGRDGQRSRALRQLRWVFDPVVQEGHLFNLLDGHLFANFCVENGLFCTAGNEPVK